MKYIDLHCDTLMWTWKEEEQENINSNTRYSVDFNRLQAANCLAQFFAIFLLREQEFVSIQRPQISDMAYIDSLIQQLQNGIKKDPKMAMAYSYQDLMDNQAKDLTSCFLTIEDGRVLNDDLRNLYLVYEKGIRLITLTWNFENSIGFPNSREARIMNRGLKNFGLEVVDAMNELGMIIDVSHLSDGGFYDVIRRSKDPIVASHSNARALSPHPRNLTDEMIRLIADKGGIIGLNFCPFFLSPDIHNPDSSIGMMVAHLNYMKRLIGTDTLALGSDFDGIGGNLEVKTPLHMKQLFQALEQEGWTEDEIEKFAYKNVERYLKEVL